MSAGGAGSWSWSWSVGAHRALRMVAFGTAAVVVVSGLSAVIGPQRATAATAAPAAAAARAERVVSRPDLVSAGVSARAQGSPVEVEALREEASTTWANPDGTLTTKAHLAPVRFRDAAGRWRDVDLDLAAAADGSVAAKGHPQGLSLAGAKAGQGVGAGGGRASATAMDLVQVVQVRGDSAGRGRRSVTVGWPRRLPAPVLQGPTATYRDVDPGVDVVVGARRTGFESSVMIRTPQALAGLVRAGGAGGVEWSLPLATQGLSVREQEDGSVAFVATDGDRKGMVVSRLTAPVAWDGAWDEAADEPKSLVPVGMSVKTTGPNRAVVTLRPDQDWLTDPARVFPITIDPTYASASTAATFDTYVSKVYPTTAYSTSTELKVGTYNGGNDVARSFLNFATSGMVGKDITYGSFSVYENHSYSCTARQMYVFGSATTTSATTWNTQPGTGAQYGAATVAKGYSSACAAGWVTISITDLVKAWAGGSTYTGVRLTASETDNLGWKKFASSETSNDPYITYTYNRKPNAASTPTVQAPPATSYSPPGGSAAVFTSDGTPTLSAAATDPDASTVQMTIEVHSSAAGTAASKVSSCVTGWVASGATGSCTSAALNDSTTYYARTAVKDDRGLWNGTWSPWRTFTTTWSAPPAPVVSCPAPYTNGSWADTAPSANVVCTVTAAGVAGNASLPGSIIVTQDGAASTVVITPSTDPNVAKTTVTIPKTAQGGHTITARAVSRSGVTSAATTSYTFGWGSATMSSPKQGISTSGTVAVRADGPPRGSASSVTGKLRWRVAGAGDETSGWTDGPALTVTNAAGGTPSSTDPVKASGSWDARTAVREAGASQDLPTRTPILLDVQVCFTYTGVATAQCTWSQSKSTLTRLPHAFGNGYPVADAGPGQVALFTGEVSLAATDVTVPGYASDITLSRSHVSFDGDGTTAGWPANPVTGVFGPGWTANLQGPDEAGLAGMSVLDNTRLDGTVVLIDEDGNPLVFQNPALTRTYPAAGTAYAPVNDDAIDADLVLTLSGSGSSLQLAATEDDGTVTTWGVLAAPVSTADTVWKPLSVSEPGQSGVTTYGHDTTGRVTRIVAAVPDGLAGTSCPTAGTLAKGCRAVNLTYATSTTATSTTPGDYTGRLTSVSATMWDPAASGGAGAMATTTVAAYAYDTTGRLVRVRDPRTGLGVDYAWDAATTRIAGVTPTGQSGFAFTYDTAANASAPKLSAVARAGATAGAPSLTLARYVYGLAVSGSGLPNVSTSAVSAWFQDRPATTGYAVFGQDYTGPVTGTGVDYGYGTFFYTDDDGYTVNTATYGAGAWQVTATDYDTRGNVVRSLDAGATARAVALKAQLGATWDKPQADALADVTIYNSDITGANGDVLTPAGTLVTDTYGPVRNATLADGTVVPARPHVRTVYDQSAPNGGINPATAEPYRLPTTITTAAADGTAAGGAPGSDLETLSTTTNGYSPVVATDGDGWTLGTPTQVTTTGAGLAAPGITRTTRFDTQGRTIETRQPLSTGSDAGTTKTIYYTTGANPADASCGNRVEWAGLTCRTYPAAAPSSGGGAAAGGAGTLPDEQTTAYTMWLHPQTTVETSGSATRTTTTTYDTAERVTTTVVTASGITGSQSRPGTFTKYRTSDGLVDYTGTLNAGGTDADPAARTTYAYDAWGRQTSYTNDLGEATTTSYGTDGRLASVTDVKGTVTYSYTSADANGGYERRGLPTKLTVTRAGTGGNLEFRAAYNPDGHLVRQNLPGQVIARTTYDDAGEPVGLSYSGQVTPVTESVDPDTGQTVYTPGTPQADQAWLSWTQTNDVLGRVRTETTGPGAAFDGVPGVSDIGDVTAPTIGQATGYDRAYTYDAAGRLTTVTDNTSDGYAATTTTCTKRTYGFDGNGRRTSLTAVVHPDGDCASTTGTTTTTDTYTYDTADRPTTAANGAGTYVYDTFGRQTTIPAADTPTHATNPAAGDITLGYHHDDLPRTVTQDGTTTTFALDSAARRLTATTTAGSSTTQTLIRHYGDDTDNPTWTATTTGGTTVVERYVEALGGGLGATITGTGDVTLPLANLHGDTITTLTIPTAQASATAAVGITGWTDYTEYGTPRTTPIETTTVTGTIGYGWLGTHQRSTTPETAGLTLMGVRLYNPARGLFTTVDPEPGGNDTAYAYPGDPINRLDLRAR